MYPLPVYLFFNSISLDRENVSAVQSARVIVGSCNMVAVLVPAKVLIEVNKDAARQHILRTHRPTSLVMVLCDEGRGKGKLLFVQSRKTSRWKFPGGGVEQGEDVLVAAFRELREEVGIRQHDLTDVLAHCLTESVDSYSSPRDGFTRGKRYYFWLMRCLTMPNIVMQHTEVINYRWCPSQLASEFISGLQQSGKTQPLILSALSTMRKIQRSTF